MSKRLLLFFTFIVFVTLSNAQQLTHRQGELLVRFEKQVDVKTACQGISRSAGTALRPVKQLSEHLNIWLCQFDFNRISERNMLETVQSKSDIHTAQLNHLIELRQTIPDDPLFENQWQWMNTGMAGTADADVDAELAWDITTGGVTENGDTIVVAVIDDGIDIDHPDLKNNLWINRNEVPDNEVDDDNNGYVDDYHGWNVMDSTDNVDNGGHGVNVSGMIAAEGNNAVGISGINWHAKVMTITGYSLDEAVVIESYTYALDQRMLYEETDGERGAFVVATNSSWGIDGGQPENAPLWCAFYDTLGAHGILSCGATANRDWNIDEVGDLPTGCSSDYLLSVTATDYNDARTFSAYGLETVDVGAPGDDIFTTDPNGEYGSTSGTSFASPLTAGLIALLYSLESDKLTQLIDTDPANTAELIRDAIFFTVDKTPQLEAEIKYGGRVNAFQAAQYLLSQLSDCPPPFRISTHQVIDTSLVLRWDLLDTVNNIRIQYREEGDTVWNEQTADESPWELTGLNACTNYELRMQSSCTDTNSIQSQLISFQTDGCCEFPQLVEQVRSDYGTGMVEWASVLAAEKYIYRYRLNPADQWMEEETTDTSIFIPGLKPCHQYQFQIATVCDTGQTSFRSIDLNVPHCKACSEQDYCGSTGQTTEDEWIESIEFGQQSFSSGANLGYLGQTNEVGFTFTPGETGQLKVRVGYAQDSFREYHKIYLDIDQNGQFEDPEEVIAASEEAIRGDFDSTYAIPANTLSGITRMRVIMKYGGFNNEPPTPCDTFNYGETEDFCVRIREVGQCDAVDTVLARDIDKESFEAYWDPADSAIAYNIRYRDTMNGGSWNYESALDTFLMINGLEECTDYEVQIRTVCPYDTSDYLAHSFIKTDCETAIASPDRVLDQIELFPNPTQDDVSIRLRANRSTKLQCRIYTFDGQLIEQTGQSIPAGPSNFKIANLQHQPEGLYLIVIDTPYERYAKKVMKGG